MTQERWYQGRDDISVDWSIENLSLLLLLLALIHQQVVMTIAQVQQDLLEGSEKFRELVTSIDAVRGSVSIQEAAVSS